MQQTREHERRDWIIILLIILIGFLCVIVAGQWAVRFSPRWELDTNMGSNLNPNSDFLTSIPQGEIEPVDAAILTPPSWLEYFLTPGASFTTFTPIPTDTVTATSTIQPTQTNTAIAASTATATWVVYITSTSYPTATRTAAPGSTSTPTSTATPTNVPSTAATNTATSTRTNTPTNTPTHTATSTPTDKPTSTPTNTPTDTPTSTPIPIDVGITKDDGVTTYAPNDVLTYKIVVTNYSTVTLNAATVTDVLPAQISSATWTCTVPAGADPDTKCDPSGTGNLISTVTLAALESVTYEVTANVSASAVGTLTNTATVTIPAGYAESYLLNNTAIDEDTPTAAAAALNVGPPDGMIYALPAGSALALNINFTTDGNPDRDLVYYERVSGSGIALDWIIIEIGDTNGNWYQIFNWFDNIPDTNSNMDFNILTIPVPPADEEKDERMIAGSDLYTSSSGGAPTGVTINIDIVPPGTYSYLRFRVPVPDPLSGRVDQDGQAEIDAVEFLP